MAVDAREDPLVRRVTLALSVLATIAVEQAVMEPGRSRTLALASTLALLIVPALVGAWQFARRDRSALSSKHRSWLWDRLCDWPLGLLLVLFALPLGASAALWLGGGRGAMPEIVLLACLRNVGLGLAVLAHWRVYARLCALVSLFLVCVASPVGGEAGVAVMAPVGAFALTGVAWLLLIYWKSFGGAAGQAAPRFPVLGLVWVAAVVGLAVVVAAVGPSRAATALTGLVGTSGGTDWSDPNARSGVGDGDNEVGGSEHPQSVGFTESEVYFETDRPSLYDAFSESYGEPFKRRQTEKMIALGPQNVGEQNERPAENLDAGREFSTLRRKPEPRLRRPGERAAKALIYIKGPTPLHLPLAAYRRFDGTTWQEEAYSDHDFPASVERSGAWFRLPIQQVSFLAGTVAHEIKVGTLDSSPLPVPPHVRRFRVGSVNRREFFAWAQHGIVRMTDRTVPAGTLINTEARTVDPERLREIAFARRGDGQSDPYREIAREYVVAPAVRALAEGWARGKARGWDQIEAVIEALRRDFRHDRTATARGDGTDVVADFLLRSRCGPDYLFASAATVSLRSLGYPTRVISGLYAGPDGYDARTRHTRVTRKDVHFWVEVRTPDGLWVAVEPTPGYDLLPPVIPWSELVARAVARAYRWAHQHTTALLAGALVLVVLYRVRRDVCDVLSTLALRVCVVRDPRRAVLRTLYLLEQRARWAGGARPLSLTLARWYRPLARQTEDEARAALERLIGLADWAHHAPEPCPGPAAREIDQICRAAARAWTRARFRALFAPRLRKAATT